MSFTIMVEMDCSGHYDGTWLMRLQRPICVPMLPPVGTVIVFEVQQDELITPDEATIKQYYFVEGEEFLRCSITEKHKETERLCPLSFLRMADTGGWKRSH